MSHKITVKGLTTRTVDVSISHFPDECPKCHNGMTPNQIAAVEINSPCLFQCVFQCPRRECTGLFVATYKTNHLLFSGNPPSVNECKRIEPIYPRPAPLPEKIRELSPDFVTIYEQAIAAESHSLDQVYGMALRKALEFLIKDFATKKNPDKESSIRKKNLMQCIKEDIDDANIVTAAERATWLGNDETHYSRTWEDKDVKDLKILVDLTVSAINSALLLAQFEEDMPDPKKK